MLLPCETLAMMLVRCSRLAFKVLPMKRFDALLSRMAGYYLRLMRISPTCCAFHRSKHQAWCGSKFILQQRKEFGKQFRGLYGCFRIWIYQVVSP